MQVSDSVPVLLNAAAGMEGEARDAEVRAAFAAHGLVADIRIRTKGQEMEDLVREIAGGNCPMLVVGGGDGSLNAAAGALAGSETALGILPMGTLNHFAKALGIPRDLHGAAGVIAAGVVRNVDVGEMNGKVFLNNASLGLYPSVVRLRTGMQERLGRSKWSAFVVAVWRSLLHYRSIPVRVKVNDEEHQCRTPFVFVGNNVYDMEGFEAGNRATLEGGKLCLYMAQRSTPWSLIRLALRALAGRLQQADDVKVLTAESFRIETPRRRGMVGVDGELVRTEAPLECRIRPRALRVLAPAP